MLQRLIHIEHWSANTKSKQTINQSMRKQSNKQSESNHHYRRSRVMDWSIETLVGVTGCF